MVSELDPRLPIIVGTGQTMIRDASTEPLEPADLMAEALRQAEADSHGRGLLAGADQVLTVSELSWRYQNPALAVAERLDALYAGLGMPTRVRQLDIPREDFPKIAADTVKNFNANAGARSPEAQIADALQLLEAAY